MSIRRNRQYVLGYLIGGLLFLVLVPLVLRLASETLDHHLQVDLVPVPWLRPVLAIALTLVGLTFGVWSNVIQNVAGHGGPLEGGGMHVSPKTQRLVTTGPYRFTRNPMLFGACVYYYGVAVALNSAPAAVLVTLFLTLMLIYVTRSEESRLLREFGDQYEEYRLRVPLFVPWRPKRDPRHGRRKSR